MSMFTGPDLSGKEVFLPASRNFMRTLIWNNCARPWYVYAETFIPAFLEFVLLLSFPFPDDVLRGYAENLAQTRGSGRAGKRHGPSRIRATGVETPAQRRFRQGLRTIVRITQPLESLGFAFLLVGGGDQFFSRWQSLMENSTFCNEPPGGFSCSVDGTPAFITPREFGQAFAFDNFGGCPAPWTSDAFTMTTGPGFITVMAALSGNARIAGIIDARLVLTVSVLGLDIYRFASDPVTVDGKGGIELVVQGNFFVPITAGAGIIRWTLMGTTQISAFEVEDGFVFAWRASS